MRLSTISPSGDTGALETGRYAAPELLRAGIGLSGVRLEVPAKQVWR